MREVIDAHAGWTTFFHPPLRPRILGLFARAMVDNLRVGHSPNVPPTGLFNLINDARTALHHLIQIRQGIERLGGA